MDVEDGAENNDTNHDNVVALSVSPTFIIQLDADVSSRRLVGVRAFFSIIYTSFEFSTCLDVIRSSQLDQRPGNSTCTISIGSICRPKRTQTAVAPNAETFWRRNTIIQSLKHRIMPAIYWRPLNSDNGLVSLSFRTIFETFY